MKSKFALKKATKANKVTKLEKGSRIKHSKPLPKGNGIYKSRYK